MKVIHLTNVSKKDIPLHYRNEYAGRVLLSGLGKEVERNIEFIIERMPTGQREISVKLTEDIDYPLAPVIKNLKEHIELMDKEGRLP